jgi:RimJ/RimL family protein N-acetyltransferase
MSAIPTFPTFVFRRLVRADLPLLHEWLQRPHVAAWWGNPDTIAELETDYFGPGADHRTRAHIAILDTEPIGFIQSYPAMGSGAGWWPEETDPGVRGIDQFLADGNRLGQGSGSAMVRAFVADLFVDPSVTRIQTDPHPHNLRAIRSYVKAGFRAVREVTTPDGLALLMHCERDVACCQCNPT